TSSLTATAPATAGTYTIRWNITTPSYFSLPPFNSLSSATTAVHLALPAPAPISPANGATGVPLTPTLAWTPSVGATAYDVYFGSSWPPALVATTTGSTYGPDELSPATQYYWQVVARNGGAASASVAWSFSTQTATGQSDQIIVTVAGGGSGPGTVDGGLATNAQLSYPPYIAVDAATNLYVQEGTGTIRKVTPEGIITTFAQFPNSGTIATDAAGNLYVASGSTVARIAPDHTLSTVAGNGTPGYSGDGGPATSAELSVVDGLAANALGDLYIADMSNCAVRKVAPSGIITTVAGNGTCGYSGDGGPARNAQLASPEGLAVDASGAVYIADTGNWRIRKLTADGVITTVAGTGTSGYSGDGGPAIAAQLSWPGGVALDGGGNLYIADAGNYRARKVGPDGIITTVAGNGSYVFSGEAGPPLSAGMTVDAVAVEKSANLYIADASAGRVRAVVPANPTSCQFRVDQNAIAVPGAGGTFPVSVQTGPGCWWGASGLPFWITGASSGKGPSTINLSVAASNDYFRSATLSIAGAAVSVTQADGWCALAASPAAVVLPAAGGTVEIGVTFCAWSWWVSSPPDWVTVAGPGTGIGSGSFRFSVGPNTGAVRYGTLLIGQPGSFQSTLPIMQLAAPTDGLHFVPVTPCRVADTRGGAGAMAAAETRSFAIPQSRCAIPDSAEAYSLNVTVVPRGPLSFLTLWPTGQDKPLVSTLNSFGGIVVANAAVVPAGFNGAVSVYVTDPTDVILDIDGYFDPAGTFAFYPVEPCRVADTRNVAGPFGGPALTGAESRDFPVPSGTCGLPSNASAYSMNVTVVPAGYLGYLKTWPTGQAQPNVSTLNSWTGKVVANAALVPAGNSGAISVYAEDTTQVVLDTNGYFGAPGGAGGLNFYPVTPCRVADTRGAAGPSGGPKMGDGETRSFPIPSSGCGIPATAAAYSLNVTVVPDGMLQYLTAWPAGAGKPLVSTLNSWDGAVVANAAIVPAGTGGAINVFVANRTQVILDINGYFAP
ncbi:MAG TPA: BACON domain-containing carbohydrate-binding protein, partial [Bryobacteraceae bacterium]|nr:BACON domain-containing carbohydrate-binding protein [Bryobacteraceae bacterium]